MFENANLHNKYISVGAEMEEGKPKMPLLKERMLQQNGMKAILIFGITYF